MARGVSMTKRATAVVTIWAMATVMRVEGNKEGDGKEMDKGSKGNGDGNEGGRQATATTWTMATATRWWATKRAIMRAERA